jgi:hypothetical protein
MVSLLEAVLGQRPRAVAVTSGNRRRGLGADGYQRELMGAFFPPARIAAVPHAGRDPAAVKAALVQLVESLGGSSSGGGGGAAAGGSGGSSGGAAAVDGDTGRSNGGGRDSDGPPPLLVCATHADRLSRAGGGIGALQRDLDCDVLTFLVDMQTADAAFRAAGFTAAQLAAATTDGQAAAVLRAMLGRAAAGRALPLVRPAGGLSILVREIAGVVARRLPSDPHRAVFMPLLVPRGPDSGSPAVPVAAAAAASDGGTPEGAAAAAAANGDDEGRAGLLSEVRRMEGALHAAVAWLRANGSHYQLARQVGDDSMDRDEDAASYCFLSDASSEEDDDDDDEGEGAGSEGTGRGGGRGPIVMVDPWASWVPWGQAKGEEGYLDDEPRQGG